MPLVNARLIERGLLPCGDQSHPRWSRHRPNNGGNDVSTSHRGAGNGHRGKSGRDSTGIGRAGFDSAGAAIDL